MNSEIILNFKVSGESSIDKDLNAFKAELGTKVAKAMDDVGADMVELLKKHIISDVYEAYPRPKVYKRRSDNSSLGTPLSDMEKNTIVFNKGAGVSVAYIPMGAHAYRKWHTDDKDQIIGKIEKKSPPYKWGNDTVPERPFWQYFVSELIEGGELDRYFASAMMMQGEIVEPTGVIRQADDGDY